MRTISAILVFVGWLILGILAVIFGNFFYSMLLVKMMEHKQRQQEAEQ